MHTSSERNGSGAICIAALHAKLQRETLRLASFLVNLADCRETCNTTGHLSAVSCAQPGGKMEQLVLLCLLLAGAINAVMSQDVTQCMMKFAGCQSAMQPATVEGQHIDLCAPGVYESVDPCTAYSKLEQCLRFNMTSCMKIPQLAEMVKNFTAEKDKVCSPASACQMVVSLCSCRLRLKPGDVSNPDANTIQTLCTGYQAYQECMAEREECAEVPMVKEALGRLKDLYGPMCPKDSQPMCMEGMTCLSQIVTGNQGNNRESGSDIPNIRIICRSAEKMFDCLGKIKDPVCGTDKNEVTFEEVKESYGETCENVVPQIEQNLQCGALDKCLLTFTGQNVSDIMALVSRIGQTDFWCSHLLHTYKCLSSSADACGFSDEAKKNIMESHQNTKETCGVQQDNARDYPDPTDGAATTETSLTVALIVAALCVWIRI